jgi:hypothetical protein
MVYLRSIISKESSHKGELSPHAYMLTQRKLVHARVPGEILDYGLGSRIQLLRDCSTQILVCGL